MKKFRHESSVKYIGMHFCVKCTILEKEAIRIYDKILNLISREFDPLEFRFWHKKLQRFINHKKAYYNTVVTVGRNISGELHVPAARRTYTGDGLIAWGALGDDATAPTIADTTLGNEQYRKAISDSSVSSNVLNVLTFWNLTEANDQHYEAGEFIDGTIAFDSGNLFARWNIDELKTGTETMSMDSYYTITQ